MSPGGNQRPIYGFHDHFVYILYVSYSSVYNSIVIPLHKISTPVLPSTVLLIFLPSNIKMLSTRMVCDAQCLKDFQFKYCRNLQAPCKKEEEAHADQWSSIFLSRGALYI